MYFLIIILSVIQKYFVNFRSKLYGVISLNKLITIWAQTETLFLL